MSEPPRAAVRVLLVDDDPLARAALRMILTSDVRIDVVGEVSDGDQVVDSVRRDRPDVVLMDVGMQRMNGLAATAAVTALTSAPRVVVLTAFNLDEHVSSALKAGASGFLLKDTPPRELIEAVLVVAAGDAILSPAVTRQLIASIANSEATTRRSLARARIQDLTGREKEVLRSVGRGLSNAEIGRELYLSEATVKAHVSRLLTKLAATNRVQVAIIAHEAGMLA